MRAAASGSTGAAAGRRRRLSAASSPSAPPIEERRRRRPPRASPRAVARGCGVVTSRPRSSSATRRQPAGRRRVDALRLGGHASARRCLAGLRGSGPGPRASVEPRRSRGMRLAYSAKRLVDPARACACPTATTSEASSAPTPRSARRGLRAVATAARFARARRGARAGPTAPRGCSTGGSPAA